MFSKNITTERINLRPYETGDVSFWQKWDTDPEVQRFMPEPINEPVSDEKQFDYLRECEEEQGGVYWTIVWRENSKPIGHIAITEINYHHGIGEIGIVVGEKEYWGKGVASEAIKGVIEFALSIGLKRLSAEFEEGNVALEKSLTKNGFRKEAVLKSSRVKNGKRIDTVRYFILL
ncbi:MAG: GNAT family N-acetyltransferase [Candidatus Pacebacteria bacterium]|nr:GNAT family N-acetyltransferase [Candidatus Paceibacterota bacterium]